MKKITLTVINDLTTDQRVHKVCMSLQKMGFDVQLIGRKLANSIPLERDYKTHRIDLFFNKGFLFYAEYNIRLFFYLLVQKKQIVLANDLDTLLPNYLISKIQSKKLVYDSHELFTEVPELVNRPKIQKIWLKLEQWLLPKLKNTYTVCNSIAAYYNNLYKTDFKVVRNVPVLKEAIGDRQYVKSQQLKANSQKLIIIYQGALNKGRGLELMIDTMQYLDNYQLIIIGDGDISNELKARVNDLKVNEKIQFLGRLEPSELPKITSKANLGISFEEDLGLNYRFALPNKIFDYIHGNVPVLVSNLPEMAALLKQYNIGEIIKERTPKALANQIENFLNSNLSAIQKNLLIAQEKLQWENEEKVLQKIFNNLSS